MKIGINLEWAKDWSQTEIFNDYMKQSSRFGKYGTPWITGGISVDEEGMPLEDFGFVLYRRAPLKSPLNMVMYYKCNGTPEITAEHHNITITSTTKDSNNISTVKFTVKEGTPQLFLKFINTNGGVSSLKLFKEGVNEKETFNPDFINLVSGFECYRYMELLEINNSNISKWEERTLPEDSSQNAKGIAWEYVAEMSNITKTDMWINIPHLVDDDYIISLANLLKDNLKYNQNIYVEYSNELWNGGMFAQSGWNVEQAILEVEAGNSNLNYDCTIADPNASNKYGWGFRRNAKRCREIAKIFESVWGKEQINKRIRVVIGGFGAVYFVSSTQLDYLSKNYSDEPVSSYIYGIANGSYYGEGNVENISTIDGLFEALNDDIEDRENRYNYIKFKDLSQQYGIKTLIYEGGVDIMRNKYLETTDTQIGIAEALKDMRMGATVKSILSNWYKESDDGLFMWYKASVGDVWGFTEDIKRTDSPIQLALRSFMNNLLSNKLPTFDKKFACKKSGVMGKGFNGISKLKNIKRGKR